MYLTEENLISSLTSFINEHYYVDTLTKDNIHWIYENEYLPSLFELYVENNYHVEQLTEGNILWIFENEFYPMIDNVLCEKNNWKTTVRGETGEAKQESTPPLPERKPKKEDDIKKLLDREKILRGLQDESTSPYVSLTASLLEAQKERDGALRSKNGLEYGEEGELTKRDILIRRLESKMKKEGLSKKEQTLLHSLRQSEEAEDSDVKKK